MENIYDLELNRVIREIKKHKAKQVLIQLPEGLKPRAMEIVDKIESQSKARCLIWIGSCYGACDIPELKMIEIDLLIQFGHSSYL